MIQAEAFEQEILADPLEDAPRLIYADWLEEQGDPRGEFIRVQCELAQLEKYDNRYGELKIRERQLLDQYSVRWTSPLKEFQDRFSFQFVRGFLELVTLGIQFEPSLLLPVFQAGKFLNHIHTFSSLVDAQQRSWPADGNPPQGRANQNQRRRVLKKIGSRVCRLTFNSLADETLKQITSLENIWEIETRSFGQATENSVQLISASNYAEKLRYLTLADGRIQPTGMAVLAKSNRLPKLERLRLDGNSIQSESLILFQDSPLAAQLKWLNLANNRFSSTAIDQLSRSTVIKKLVRLDLSNVGADTACFSKLINAEFWPQLEWVSLAENSLSKDWLLQLSQAKQGKLRYLNINHAPQKTQSVRQFTSSENAKQLAGLEMNSCKMSAGALRAIAESEQLQHLRLFHLATNQLGDKGAITIANSNLRHLRDLNLAYNEIGPEGLISLANSPNLEQISSLTLWGNKPNEKAISALKQRFGKRVWI